MRDRIVLYKLVKAIVIALNRLPNTRARGASVYEFAFSTEPQVLAVTLGRAVFLKVNLPARGEESDEALAALNLWYSNARARVAVVDSVEGALAVVTETSALAAYENEQVGEYIFERHY